VETVHFCAFYALFMTSKGLIVTQDTPESNIKRACKRIVLMSCICIRLIKLLSSWVIWSVTY